MAATILLVIIALFTFASAYKILGLFPYEGKSHFISFEPLLKALAAKGHEVTVISHFPQKTPLPNLNDIDIGGSFSSTGVINLDYLTGSRFQKYLTPIVLAYLGYQSCVSGLSNKNFQNFIKTDSKFDLIISEAFNTECFLGLVNKLKSPPLILIHSCILLPWQDDILAMPSNPAYILNHFMPFSIPLSFFERVENTILYIFHHFVFKLFIDIPGKIIARSHFGSDIPSLTDISLNASVLLINTHFTSSGAQPMVPGYIEVGGMHVETPKALPKHIEKWINESTHGVIYFSLGSMIKGHSFPEDKRQMFIRAFSRFPQRVLWKWEADTMPEKPENIMIEKWMPQFDILCHPNVKAFIAHGGLLGVTESVHCGVPLIVMPQFGDQFTNAKAIEANGGGVILEYRSLDEESIVNALKTVLDPSFNKKAKELSARFRDRPMPPLETAIYWVEYVARHGGAPHLRTAAVGMPLYQYLLLDVITFLSVILFILMYISFVITRAIYRKIFKIKEKVKQN
ncbi:hypothetical protein RN001_003187 [Aquatica leii]|uniref:UDP-glucuronosyltransferase n=1 Tax=Aquatica leii TaxID=1421715 RepID=A0AAN7PNC2_9COLE|nr:hypothetical protein RN001_003187 [Aquatica leii]